MERGGLIRREACPNDRRSSYAVITEAGVTRLEEILPGHLQLVQQWFIGQLEPAQLDQMLDSLRIIRDAVNPCATAGSTGEDHHDPSTGPVASSPLTRGSTGRSTGRTAGRRRRNPLNFANRHPPPLG
nr:hypothetical protein GCM10020092_001800 [Actinoplanes digitatis]